MEFVTPVYAYLLILLPLAAFLAAGARARDRRARERLGNPELLSALSANISRPRRRWRAVLWIVAFLAMVLALARPQWGTEVTVRAQEGVEVMVALDVSASMLAEDVKPSRLERAKLTVEELLDELGGNDVGLVVFSGAAFVQFPLTADFNTARAFLDAAGPATISQPGTALEQAIDVALDGFDEERSTSRVLLLMTDGEGHFGDPLAAAKRAAELGVIIHAVGFGSPAGEPIPIRDVSGAMTGYKRDAAGEVVLSRLDEGTLQQITAEAGGLYYRASAGGGEIEEIVRAISGLETGETEGQFETLGVERSEWFAGAALLALAAQGVIGERKRNA